MIDGVIAEAGQCMEGSADDAVFMAECARDAGCTGFKVQVLSPDTLVTRDAPTYWGDPGTQHASFERSGVVPRGAWAEVKDACDAMGIEFLGTPFDVHAVDLLLGDLGCGYVKVASGDVSNVELLEAVRRYPRAHVILSTGACTLREVSVAVRVFLGMEDLSYLTLLACTLSYPTADEDAELGRVDALRAEFPGASVGYSDHTLGTDTALALGAMGVTTLEKHFTTRPDGELVPDHAMALSPDEMSRYVERFTRGRSLRGSGQLGPLPAELPARQGARRSVFFARDVRAGQVITAADVVMLRPRRADALAAEEWGLVAGSTAMRDHSAGEPVPPIR